MTKLYKIKPLVWEKYNEDNFLSDSSVTGLYRVCKGRQGWWATFPNASYLKSCDIEDGKAKCNAHYTAFLEQALEEVSEGQGE